jgi:hypothetical protein
VTEGTGAIFQFEDDGPRPDGLKGCAIRRPRGIAVLGVSSLVLKLPWSSDHVCNGGTWKIPVRPGAPRRSFPKEIIPDFSRENLEKNRVFLEKNPVSL